jgi:hypothetical protein
MFRHVLQGDAFAGLALIALASIKAVRAGIVQRI